MPVHRNLRMAIPSPYPILGIATLFVIAHLFAVKRRLSMAERNIQTLRNVILGVDVVPLR